MGWKFEPFISFSGKRRGQKTDVGVALKSGGFEQVLEMWDEFYPQIFNIIFLFLAVCDLLKKNPTLFFIALFQLGFVQVFANVIPSESQKILAIRCVNLLSWVFFLYKLGTAFIWVKIFTFFGFFGMVFCTNPNPLKEEEKTK